MSKLKCLPTYTCTWLAALKWRILEMHKKVRAIGHKPCAIIEAEQNIFRHFHKYFAYCQF